MATSRSFWARMVPVMAIALISSLNYAAAQSGQDFTQGVQYFEDGQYERAINTLNSVVEDRPELESGWYFLGRSYINMPQPDYEAALEAFNEALQLNPHRPGIRLYIGKIYEDQGAYKQAIQVYQEEFRLRKGRDVQEVKLALGRVYCLDGQHQKTVSTLTPLVRDAPEFAEALYYLGIAETGLESYTDAIEHFRQANEACREYQSLHSRLEQEEMSVVEQRRRGMTEEYLAEHYGNAEHFVRDLNMWPELNKAEGDAHMEAEQWSQARSAYRDMLDPQEGGNPADPEPDVLVAKAFLSDARDLFHTEGVLFQTISLLEAGLESVNKAIEKNENFAPAYNAQGEIYLFQAQTYVTMPDLGVTSHTYADAIESFEKALDLREDYFSALNNLGVALTETGQADRAVERLNQAIELKPDAPEARASLAKAYLGQERAQEALEEAQSALAADPDNYEALLTAGLVDFMYRNQMGSAIDYFTKATREEPGRADAYLHMGNAFYQMESWYRARDQYMTALELIPEAMVANTSRQRARINYLIGHTYHQAMRYEKEIEHLNRALALQPTYLPALRQIARAYQASDQYRAARVALQSALQSSPDLETDAEIYVQLAELHEKQGQPHDAIAAYTAALNADDTNLQAQRGLERLGAQG